MNLLVVHNKLATASLCSVQWNITCAHAIKHIDFTWLATNSGNINPVISCAIQNLNKNRLVVQNLMCLTTYIPGGTWNLTSYMSIANLVVLIATGNECIVDSDVVINKSALKRLVCYPFAA